MIRRKQNGAAGESLVALVDNGAECIGGLGGDGDLAHELEQGTGLARLPADRLRKRMDDIIQLNSLQPYVNRLASQLSGGWKQRLALGCAMLHEPQLIFLDEPTAGIDPVARRQLWDLLFELSAHGITFFVTTHYMDEAERCSHVAYIYFGKVIADGTPDSLREIPAVNIPGTYRVEISAPHVTTSLRVARTISGVRSATIFGQSIHALIDDTFDLDDLREQLSKSGIAVAEIRPLAPSLEDVFVELTYRNQRNGNSPEDANQPEAKHA